MSERTVRKRHDRRATLRRALRRRTVVRVPIRLRVPEIFEEKGLTAYEIAKRSGGRIQAPTLYRLARRKGEVSSFDAELLDVLCDVLEVEPGDLLEREREGKRKRNR